MFIFCIYFTDHSKSILNPAHIEHLGSHVGRSFNEKVKNTKIDEDMAIVHHYRKQLLNNRGFTKRKKLYNRNNGKIKIVEDKTILKYREMIEDNIYKTKSFLNLK